MTNYNAWNIKESDYPEKGSLKECMKFILGYAILAPSAHNTQPWHIDILENRIKISISTERSLGYSDKSKRQTYESIGAFLENLMIALEHFGYYYSYELLYDNSVMVMVDDFKEIKASDNLFNNITKRHSAKLGYVREAINEHILEKLKKLNRFHNININFYSEVDNIKAMAKIVGEGTEEAFLDKEFCNELSKWVRASHTKKHTGMPAHTMGIPKILTGLIPFAIKNLKMAKMQAKNAEKIVLNTGTIGIISGKNEIINWIEAGQLYEQVSLSAISYGYNTSIMGAPIESEMVRKKLKDYFKIVDEPILFFRIGKQKKNLIKSPRFTVLQIINN